MIVRLKQNLNNGKEIYKANTAIDLSKTLGYDEIPERLNDVLEEVKVAGNLKISVIDEDDEKEAAETKATKKTTKTKKTSKSTNTLDLDNLDVNV